MAPNDGQTIAASWNALVNDKPEDNTFEDYWFLNRLKNGEGFLSVDGGDVITVSLEYATNGTVTWYSDTETISTTRQETFDRAEYSWKECAGSVVQSELENAINQGSAKKFDLLDAKMRSNVSCRVVEMVSVSEYQLTVPLVAYSRDAVITSPPSTDMNPSPFLRRFRNQ